MRASEMFVPRPTKGFTPTGHRMLCFDAVRACRDTACPLHEACPYPRGGKCLVETKYLAAVLENLMKIPGNKMTQEFLDKITLHLIPLFHQLIKFQIRAYAVEDVVYETAQGMIKVHPIFTEIRKTIAAIEATQKSLGVDLEYHRALGLVRGTGTAAKERDASAYGDPGYTEAMGEEVEDIRRETESALFPDGKRDPNLKRAKRRPKGEDAESYAEELEEDMD